MIPPSLPSALVPHTDSHHPSASLSRAGSTGRFRNQGPTTSANASATKQMFQTYSGASGYKSIKKRQGNNAATG